MSFSSPPSAGERLAKVMARAGVCSRRDAETWIGAGRVSVNGEIVRTPAFNVTEADVIVVDGKPLAQREPTQAWIYHKPAGFMVTERDPEGRPTVFEQFEQLGLPRVVTIGRLDFNTEGLLILTNDGGVKRTLELPSTGWVRRYRVRAFGKVTQDQLDSLKHGITVEGVEYGPIEATLDSEKGSNVWLTLGLREGKNREVRNVLGSLGLEVNRLIRISYGPFQLGELGIGAVEKIRPRVLRDQLGTRLAEQSGADFEGAGDAGSQPRRRTPDKPPSRAPERDRYTGLRRRPERAERPSTEERPRTLHFDDGRPSQSFVPGAGSKRGGSDDRTDRGARPTRDERGARGARPERRDGDRPFGDRPPRRDGDRPFAKGPRREGDKPFVKRPPREGGERPQGRGPRPEGDARPPRHDGDRPFGDRPPRRDGDRPFAKGPRREGDKPFVKRPPREGGERPQGRGSRPEGEARPPRRDGKPGGSRPTGSKPFRTGKPGGKPTDRPAGASRTKPGGGRPSGPRRPRRDSET